MPICVSCRVPHHTEDCDQHKPHNTALSGQPAAGAGVMLGPECEGGDTHTGGRASVAGRKSSSGGVRVSRG